MSPIVAVLTWPPQVRAARRVAQGRAKPVDWLVQDLYGLGEDEGGQEFRNDEADDSEDEREELRRQVCCCLHLAFMLTPHPSVSQSNAGHAVCQG